MIDQRIEKGPSTIGAEGRQNNPDRQGSRRDESSQFSARSLKGAVLRLEIYALDRKEESDRPYSVSERNYTIKRLQPFGGNQRAVFFTHSQESILESGDCRAPLPCESRTYKLLKVCPSANARGGTNLFRFVNSHIISAGDQAATPPYQEWGADEESVAGPRRRLIGHLRVLYRKNDLSAPLPHDLPP